MSCPVCYTDDADMVVCWNDHGLCETCYRECLKPRVRNDEIAGVDKYHVNDKCPTCREPMFDWFDLVVENMNNTMIAPVRRITTLEMIEQYITNINTLDNIIRRQRAQPQPVRQRSAPRCSICRNIGHNRRTCPNRT